MFCSQCGNEMQMNARFCAQCGKQWRFDGSAQGVPRLMRNMSDRKIAGVCSGLARYMNVDVVLVRIVLLTLALGAGMGFIAYIIAWIVMPKDSGYPMLAPPMPASPPPSA